MKKKYVLFDFDGVIANTEESNSRYLALALKEFGVELTQADKKRMIGRNDPLLLAELLNRAPQEITPEQLAEKRKEVGNTYENGEISPMRGLTEFIRKLRQNKVKTAIVTSSSSHLILMALNRMKMINLFDVIVCGDMCRARKPDPECYLKAMELLEAKPEECIVFEDSPAGIWAAKQAEAEVIAYTGSGIEQDVSQADYVISAYEECEKMI